MKIRLMAKGQDYEVEQVGVFSPKPTVSRRARRRRSRVPGRRASRSSPTRKIGDTITETEPADRAGLSRLQGKRSRWCSPGSIRSRAIEYAELRDALEKLRLNDASFFFEPETSAALGFGFRCGFLGLLHMEIVQERLEREFNMDLVTTAPGVLYRVTTTDGEVHEIDSPAKLPEPGRIQQDRGADHHRDDPDARRARRRDPEAVSGEARCAEEVGVPRVGPRALTYELPFNEVVLDFYDRLKTISRGYASLDYHVTGYWDSPLGQAGHPGQRRAGRRAVDHRASRHVATQRGRALAVEDARADSPPDVRGRDSGRHRAAASSPGNR